MPNLPCTKCGTMKPDYLIKAHSEGWCSDCHNKWYAEGKANRKKVIQEYYAKYNQAAIKATGLQPGDKVHYFARDMLTGGLLGSTEYKGTVTLRNGKICIKLDNSRKYAAIHAGWKKI